ncbi:MAG TPA: metallophosphoesterase [Methanothrix sp.]|nr:metallophosphoesterase [Methanothrix sp.]HOK57529.1 metallophosphoesterase [Methanothrix sp.]HOL42933.1 metallophosphoesterase [Methanothrix sp.]HPO87814.1 metallophosphoesterase [Methanothrix sp.]
MRVLLISDTHLDSIPEGLLEILSGYDMILHAGDLVSMKVWRDLGSLCETHAVAGNSDHPDVRRSLPERLKLDVEGMSVGIIHRPSHSPDSPGTALMAREMDVDLLVFGHFHKPIFERDGSRMMVCPGSPTSPRLSPPSVAELILEGGKASLRIVPVGKPMCGYLQFAETLYLGGSDESA